MQAACAPHGDAASSLAADGDVKEDLRARRQWREHAPSACAETAGRTLLVTLGPFFAAEAVARQATISLSGDIGNAWQKLEQGVSLVTGLHSGHHSTAG